MSFNQISSPIEAIIFVHSQKHICVYDLNLNDCEEDKSTVKCFIAESDENWIKAVMIPDGIWFCKMNLIINIYSDSNSNYGTEYYAEFDIENFSWEPITDDMFNSIKNQEDYF